MLALGCRSSGGCSVSVSSDKVCYLLVAVSGCGGGWAPWAQLAPLCFTGYRCPFPDRERVKQAQLHIPTAVPAWFLSDRTQRSLITHLYKISNSLYGHKKRGRIFLSTEPWLGELYLPQVQISPLWALDSCKIDRIWGWQSWPAVSRRQFL